MTFLRWSDYINGSQISMELHIDLQVITPQDLYGISFALRINSTDPNCNSNNTSQSTRAVVWPIADGSIIEFVETISVKVDTRYIWFHIRKLISNYHDDLSQMKGIAAILKLWKSVRMWPRWFDHGIFFALVCFHVYMNLSTSQFHAWPSAVRGIVMLRVDNFPYPRN